MAIPKKKKENVTITLSPYLKKQLDQMVESGDFSSMSDLATMALTEFIGKYNQEQKASSKTSAPISIDIIKTGISLVEAGEYEEAKKYFAKAKELESFQSSEQGETQNIGNEKNRAKIKTSKRKDENGEENKEITRKVIID
jgi:Arc/MetJ-type ribon-helix-helix transcriptional regulator